MTKSFIEKAHGRVNLIGEHTDYNGGWGLPTAIPQYTQVSLIKRNDQKVNLISTKGTFKRDYSFTLGQERKTGQWVDYLMGATKLISEASQTKGQTISGFDALIESNMPEGSGLSSSDA